MTYKFIQRRVLPHHHDLTVIKFNMRELIFLKSLHDFHENYLSNLKSWSTIEGNFFPQLREVNFIQKLEDIPLFEVEVGLMDDNLRELNIKFLTNKVLIEFISEFDQILNLHKVIEEFNLQKDV